MSAKVSAEERARRKAADEAATARYIAQRKAQREAENAPTIGPITQYSEALSNTKSELAQQSADIDRKLKVIAIIPVLLNFSRYGHVSVQLDNLAHQEHLNILVDGLNAYKELNANNNNSNNENYPVGMPIEYRRLTHPNYMSNNNNNANSNNSNTTAFTKKASMAKRRKDALYRQIQTLTDEKNHKVIADTIKTITDRNEEDALEDIVMAPEFSTIIRIIEQPVKMYLLWKQHHMEEREASRGIRNATAAKEAAIKAAREAKEADRNAKMRQLFETYYVGGPGANDFYEALKIVNDSGHMTTVYLKSGNEDEIDIAMTNSNAFTELARLLAEQMQRDESAVKPKRLDDWDLEYVTNRVDRRKRDLFVLDGMLEKRKAENAASGSAAASVNTVRLINMRKMLVELITRMMTEINKGNPRTYKNNNLKLAGGRRTKRSRPGRV